MNRITRRSFLIIVVLGLIFFTGSAMARRMASGYKLPYYIGVDLSSEIVTIYNTSDDTVAYQCLSSTGNPKITNTPTGVYYLPPVNRANMRSDSYYKFIYFDSWAKWATRIDGGYLFHTMCYLSQTEGDIDLANIKAYGTKDSHGCVRLRTEDARFLALNCGTGTYTRVYFSGDAHKDLWDQLYFSTYGWDAISYNRFLGHAENDDELGVGSTGDTVRELKERLQDYGYFTGTVDSEYDDALVLAVKRVERAFDMVIDGVTTPRLMQLIMSDDLPYSTARTLQNGDSGSCVRRLKEAMQLLGFFDGEINDTYDGDLQNAVADYQKMNYFAFEADGIAEPEIQAGIFFHYEELIEKLGGSDGITSERKSETIKLGKVNSKSPLKLHAATSMTAKRVGTASPGEVMIVAKTKDEWAYVWDSTGGGYMKSRYLTIIDYPNDVVVYQREGSDEVYQMGHTMDEYNEGMKSFAIAFDKYYWFQWFYNTDTTLKKIITVNTGSAGASLNMRAEKDPDSEILTAIPNETRLQVIQRDDEWTMVSYKKTTGYVRNDFVTEPETAWYDIDTIIAKGKVEDTTEETVYALVVTAKGQKAPVYDAESGDLVLLGSLKAGVKVEVEYVEGEWAFISLSGHEGKMYVSNLNILEE